MSLVGAEGSGEEFFFYLEVSWEEIVGPTVLSLPLFSRRSRGHLGKY